METELDLKSEKTRKVVLALGGFCPLGFRKMDAKHPYQWVYIDGLSNYRMRNPSGSHSPGRFEAHSEQKPKLGTRME